LKRDTTQDSHVKNRQLMYDKLPNHIAKESLKNSQKSASAP